MYLPSRWRFTDPGYLFAQGTSYGEALLVREGLFPAFTLHAPFLVLLSSGYRLQRLWERKPPGHSSLRPAFLRVLSLTPFTCDPKREFKHFPESDFNRSNDLNYSWSFLLPEGDKRIRKETIELQLKRIDNVGRSSAYRTVTLT